MYIASISRIHDARRRREPCSTNGHNLPLLILHGIELNLHKPYGYTMYYIQHIQYIRYGQMSRCIHTVALFASLIYASRCEGKVRYVEIIAR